MTTGTAREPAPGTLERLLPVIRSNGRRRGAFSRPEWGIGVYPGEIVVFQARPRYGFPEAAYEPGGASVLVSSRACRRSERIPLGEVLEVEFRYPRLGGGMVRGEVRTTRKSLIGRKRYPFAVPVSEMPHVRAALEALCGDRLTVRGTAPAPRSRPAPPKAAAAGRPPRYSKRAAMLLRVLAVAVMPLSVGGGVAVALGADLPPEGVFGIALALVAASGVGSYYCLVWAYHLGLTPAAELLASDPRPIVLYLRSFGDDGTNNLHPVSVTAQLFGLGNPRGSTPGAFVFLPVLRVFGYAARLVRVYHLFRGVRVRTAEEQFSRFFSRLGPFVAIGRPGETRVTGGAARLYVGAGEWQARVTELLQRARIVLLQPEETEGVWWEIMEIVQRVPPETVLFCLVNYSESQQRYEEFRLKLEGETGIVLPRMIGRHMFLYFTPSWQPRMLESRYASELTWPFRGQAIDLGTTLAPFLARTDPPPFSERDRRFRGHGPLAAVAYLVLGVFLLFAIPAVVVLLTR